MAITFRAWGAFASGTTSASAAAAAGALSTDLHIGFVGNKPYTSTPTATNFTGGSLASAAGGAVGGGNGTGSPRSTAFYKTGASAALNAATTSGSPTMARQCSVYATNGLETPVGSAAGDATVGAAVSISGTQTEGFNNGDLVLFALDSGDDAHTVTSIALSIGGVAQTLTVEAKSSTTSGNDGLAYYGRCVVAGITNGATAWVLTGTSSNTTTAYFSAAVVRVRELGAPPVPNNAAHAQTAGSPTLTQVHNLTVQGATHDQIAGYGAGASANLIPTDAIAGAETSTGWVASNCSAFLDNTNFLEGSASISAAKFALSASLSTPNGTSAAPVAANLTYTARAEIRAATTGLSAKVSILWFDDLGDFFGSSEGTSTALANGVWELRSVTAQAPSGAFYGAVQVTYSSSLTGGTISVDRWGLKEGSTTAWSLPSEGGGLGDVPLSVVSGLVVQNAAHAQTANTVTGMTQLVNITAQNASHAQTAQNVPITKQSALPTASAAHAQTAGNVSLTQVHNLTVQSAAHAQSAGNVAMVYAPNPEWVAGAETYITASGTAVLTVPAAKQAGDLAFLVASTDGGGDPLWSPPAGWTLLGHTAATNMHSYIWTRELDGSETTVSLAHSSSITLVMGIWRHATLGVAGAFGIRSGTNFDITAPDITPTGYKAFLFADRTIDTGGVQPDQINSLTYGTVRYSSVGNPANDAGSAISTVYFVDAPPPRGGANTVTMADSSSNAWGLSVELVPKYGVRIQNAAHAQSAENVSISQQQNITAQNAAHLQTAGSVTLTQVHNLVPANARSLQAAGNVTLTQTHILTVANARSLQTAGNVALIVNLAVQNARSLQTAGSPTLVERLPNVVDLIVPPAVHVQSATTVQLVQVLTLTGVGNAQHAQTATSPVLQHVQFIAQVYGSVHNQKAGNVALVQNSTLQVEDCFHYHEAHPIRLSQFAVAYQFVTPTEPSVVFTDERLISYLRPPGGVTLLLEGGIVTEVQFPTQDQVNAADTAYIGGHQYTVTEEAAQVLRDAGYTANLYETVVEV